MRMLKPIFNFFEKRAWLCWSLTIIYMAIIFYYSAQSYFPPSSLPGLNISDKIKHAVLYMGLGILFYISLKSTKIKKSWLFSILFTTLYGISDEIHQLFVPNRMCSIGDMIANAVGAIIGASLIWFLRNGFKGKNT